MKPRPPVPSTVVRCGAVDPDGLGVCTLERGHRDPQMVFPREVKVGRTWHVDASDPSLIVAWVAPTELVLRAAS